MESMILRPSSSMRSTPLPNPSLHSTEPALVRSLAPSKISVSLVLSSLRSHLLHLLQSLSARALTPFLQATSTSLRFISLDQETGTLQSLYHVPGTVANRGEDYIQNPPADIYVVDALKFYTNLLLKQDLGFAESYLDGYIAFHPPPYPNLLNACQTSNEGSTSTMSTSIAAYEKDVPCLLSILSILIKCRESGAQLHPFFVLLNKCYWNSKGLLNSITRVFSGRDTEKKNAAENGAEWRFGWGGGNNTEEKEGSRRNIELHYDLGNRLFQKILGRSWTYSCAMFKEKNDFVEGTGDGVVEGRTSGMGETDEELQGMEGDELDRAQWRKLDRIIEKLRLGRHCRVLDIGSGWGELAIRIAKKYKCTVIGITLSKEQLELSQQRAKEHQVQEYVQFLYMDYRQLPEYVRQHGRFDRIVSVEMLEAVGHQFLSRFFEVIEDTLSQDGLLVLQVITTPECRYKNYLHGIDFIQGYIFPGACCPSIDAVLSAAASGSKLSLEECRNIGPHYAKTLHEWRNRFLKAVEDGTVEAEGFDQVFIRKWVYYFCYCEAGFRSRTLGLAQMLFSRPGNTKTLDAFN